jgi:hypothetical protein
MSAGTETNINRKIAKITVRMSELDLHVSERENLASTKKPSGEKREIAALQTC